MERDLPVDFEPIKALLAPHAEGLRTFRLSETLPSIQGVELRGTPAALAQLVMVILDKIRAHQCGEVVEEIRDSTLLQWDWVVVGSCDFRLYDVVVVDELGNEATSGAASATRPVRFRERLGLLGCGLIGFGLLFLCVSGVFFWAGLLGRVFD